MLEIAEHVLTKDELFDMIQSAVLEFQHSHVAPTLSKYEQDVIKFAGDLYRRLLVLIDCEYIYSYGTVMGQAYMASMTAAFTSANEYALSIYEDRDINVGKTFISDMKFVLDLNTRTIKMECRYGWIYN